MSHGVQVAGSPGFLHLVERAFELLREWAPEWYTYVATAALHKIEQMPNIQNSGVFIDTRTFVADNTVQTEDEVTFATVVAMVGSLAHEACHLHQWNDGTATVGWRNELACLQAQLAATEAVDPLDRFSYWLKGLIRNIENPAYWWWTD